MSGSVSTYPFPITLGTTPPDHVGSKGASVRIVWDSVSSKTVSVNLLSQFQTGQFATVQAVWVDNSTVPFPVFIASADEQQTLLVPAFTQGTYPLILGPTPNFTITERYSTLGGSSNLSGGTTRLIFLNTLQSPYQESISLMPYGWVSNQSAGSFNTYTVIGAPPTGQRYLVFGWQITCEFLAAYPGTAVNSLVQFGEQIGGSWFYQSFTSIAASQTGIFYSQSLEYASPILCPNGQPLVFTISGQSASATVGYAANLQYGLVTIA